MVLVKPGTKAREALATLKYWPLALEMLDAGTPALPMAESMAAIVAAEAATPIELTPCESCTFLVGDEEITVNVQPLADYHAAIDAYRAKRVRETLKIDRHMHAALVFHGWVPPCEEA